MGSSEKECLKILMFPWLAHGHISPFIELAKKLSERNFQCYICSTPVILNSIKHKIPEKYPVSIHLVELHLPNLPELPPHYHTTSGLPLNLNPTLQKALLMAKPDFSNLDEKIGLCRFSKDGKKPFLFCSVQRGNTSLTVVWDISTWKKIGHRRLLRKPASIMSVSLDGKYLALGSKDGDICVVEVEKMEVCHWSKRLHLGSNITSLEFCPSERIILSSSSEWGAMVTKLTVPADWKDWQIYLFLLGLFLASLVVFYVLYQNSDSFWNFPLANDQTPRSNIKTVLRNEQSDPSMWKHLDL